MMTAFFAKIVGQHALSDKKTTNMGPKRQWWHSIHQRITTITLSAAKQMLDRRQTITTTKYQLENSAKVSTLRAGLMTKDLEGILERKPFAIQNWIARGFLPMNSLQVSGHQTGLREIIAANQLLQKSNDTDKVKYCRIEIMRRTQAHQETPPNMQV